MHNTPILDLEQPLPATPIQRGGKVVRYISGGIIGLLIAFGSDYLGDWHLPGFNGLLFVPLLFAAIAIHEFGHLLTGRLAGLHAGGISIGPFAASRSGDRWTYRLDWTRWAGGMFLPLTPPEGISARRFGCMVAGGPGSNLLCAVLALMAWMRWGDGGFESIGTLFWVSAAVFGLSMIPLSDGTIKSDSARLWQLATKPETLPALLAALNVQTTQAHGKRPRDWDARAVETMSTVSSETSEYIGIHLLLYYRKLDQTLDEEALVHLEKTLERCGRVRPHVRRLLLLEAAASSALVRRNAQQASEWLRRALAIKSREPVDVVLGAIAMLEGHYDEAITNWVAARERVDRMRLDSGVIRFAKEKWAEYEDACREAIRGRAASAGT